MTHDKTEGPAEASRALAEGELWSWTRSVMSQGACIYQDYAAGTHKGYEAYSAHMDAAASKRADELSARLATPQVTEAPSLGAGTEAAERPSDGRAMQTIMRAFDCYRGPSLSGREHFQHCVEAALASLPEATAQAPALPVQGASALTDAAQTVVTLYAECRNVSRAIQDGRLRSAIEALAELLPTAQEYKRRREKERLMGGIL